MVFKIIPRCFWDEACLIGLLLKSVEGRLFFWSLLEKRTFWACLLGSGLKLILHWNAQLLIFFKALFKWVTKVLILWTMEKSKILSAKHLAFVNINIIKNNSGLSMDPWGNPVLMLVHEESCLFKTTCCFLMIVFKMLPDMLFCLSLYIRPLCYTLLQFKYI